MEFDIPSISQINKIVALASKAINSLLIDDLVSWLRPYEDEDINRCKQILSTMTRCNDTAVETAAMVANETLFPSKDLLCSIARIGELMKIFINNENQGFDAKGSFDFFTYSKMIEMAASQVIKYPIDESCKQAFIAVKKEVYLEFTGLSESITTICNTFPNNHVLATQGNRLSYPVSLASIELYSIHLDKFLLLIKDLFSSSIEDHTSMFVNDSWLVSKKGRYTLIPMSLVDRNRFLSGPVVPKVIIKLSSVKESKSPSQVKRPIVSASTDVESKVMKVDRKPDFKADSKADSKVDSKVGSEKSESDHELETEGGEDTDDDYPHHSAREGSRYQANVRPFDPKLSRTTQRKQTPQDRLWDPDRIREEDLDSFISIFPADVLEHVFEVIVNCDYDLDKAYEELVNNPPLNPITRFNPEDEKRLEDNIDNLSLVHNFYFPYVKITEVVDLYYHMDASFKDDICTICLGSGTLIFCSKCPRGFHKSCIRLPNVKEFICPFCLINKENLSPSEMDRILAKYRHHLNTVANSRTSQSRRR